MVTGARKWRAVAAVLALSAAKGGAAKWTVIPSVELRETYTDNAFIGSDPARSDFITQVTPGIRIDGRSPRLAANLRYTPSALFYARNSEANDVANYLDASGRLEAVEKFFFVEAAANVNQSFITPFAPQPGDITTVTQNRVETRTLSFSPYVKSEGRYLEYELRNRNTWTDSDREGLGNFRTQQWTGRVARPVRRFGWALEFDATDNSQYGTLVDRPDDKARLYRGRVYYQPDPAWRLSASAGSEENNYILQQTQRTTIYGAGLAWHPSPRTSAELEYENRFFGPSRLARFNHRTRLTAWNVGYSRNTSTYQEEVLRLPPGNTTALLDSAFAARFPDVDQRRAAVEQFMRASGTPAFLSSSLAFYTQRVYLREGVDASVAVLGKRNSIAFTAFAAESSDLSVDALGIVQDPFRVANTVRQRGFGANAMHLLAPATSIAANANRIYSRQEQPLRFDSRNDYFNVLLTHTISPKTTTSAGVSVSRFDSDEPGFIPNQDSTSVSVGLSHRF